MNTLPEMTLRDYFAVIALKGIIAKDDGFLSKKTKEEIHVERAYRYADTMLKVRDKELRYNKVCSK